MCVCVLFQAVGSGWDSLKYFSFSRFRLVAAAIRLPHITYLWASQLISGEVSTGLFSTKYCLMRSSTSAEMEGSVKRERSSLQDCGRLGVSGNAIVIEIGWWLERNIGSMDMRWRIGRLFCEMKSPFLSTCCVASRRK